MPARRNENHMEALKDRRILIGMTGSIACYKACGVVSGLIQRGAVVRVMMPPSATRFVRPLTLEALTGYPVAVEMFGEKSGGVGQQHIHIDLARFPEIVCVIPATANIIGKMAGGIADDLVSTTLLSTTAPLLLAPSMNLHLYGNPIVQRNLQSLRESGYHIVDPDEGFLSCGDYGRGRLPDSDDLIHEIIQLLRRQTGLEGKTVLVSAGRTEEPFDPVRYLSNKSSGKMGYAIARAARRSGAEVILISGPTELREPRNMEVIHVRTSEEMSNTVMLRAGEVDIVVMAAAVSDFTPSSYSDEKIRRREGGMSVPLRATDDILARLGSMSKKRPFLAGFAMETSDVEENALRKLKEKGIDVIVANNPLDPDTGFGTDFIKAIILDSNGVREELPVLEKGIMAERLIEFMIKVMDG